MNIGILASGGDGAGMNMFLYNLVKNLKGHNIILFKSGYEGLMKNEVCDFNLNFLKSKKNCGGICIKTSRSPKFMEQQGKEEALKTLKKDSIDVLVVMGGNGSLKGAKSIEKNGTKIVFVPCSIDNDIYPSKYAIGFDTACKTCEDYINKVQDTMLSFDRVCIYEVMGRDCDAIAKKVGYDAIADYTYTDTSTFDECLKSIDTKKSAPIIVLQENVLDVDKLATDLQQKLNREVKYCVVGYIQRGGKPTKKESDIAIRFAKNCANYIKNGKIDDFVFCSYEDGEVVCKPF